jgi:hypothetical protein
MSEDGNVNKKQNTGILSAKKVSVGQSKEVRVTYLKQPAVPPPEARVPDRRKQKIPRTPAKAKSGQGG